MSTFETKEPQGLKQKISVAQEAPLQAQRVPVSKPDAGDSFLRASWAASDV